MSDDQKNPPAQPEFGELAPEGWSWNPEANAPHTPETLKAAASAAKAAAKAKAATAATNAKAPKAAPAIFVAPPAAGSEPDTAGQHTTTQTLAQQSLSEDEQKTRAVAVAKLASDRFITWGLLGVAVFSVVSGLGDYVNLTRTLNAAFDQLNTMEPGLNLEPYANLGLASLLGWGIVLAQAVVIGLTFWWAIRRMRTGRMAFWVPVVGFAISSAAVLGFMIFAFVGDPTAWNALVAYIQTVPSVAPATGSTT